MAQLEKIMSIYYGHDKLPYKDYDRQVHYPIGGGDLFIGENNVTTIRFYVDRIGGNDFTWLAVVKLPNGTRAFKQLDAVSSDGYVDLDVSSIYTSQVGAIYVSLQGYTAEDIVITEDDNVYSINGDPDVIVTGCCKIMVNYAPQVMTMGTDISFSQYQQIIALLATKANKNQPVVFYNNISSISSNEIAKDNLKDGQLCYDKTTQWFYSYDLDEDTFVPISFKDLNGKRIVDINSTTHVGELYGAIPTLDYDMSITINQLVNLGYDKVPFIVKNSNGISRYIYSFLNTASGRYRIGRFSIDGNGYEVYQNSTTQAGPKTLAQIFDDVSPLATKVNYERTSYKVTTIDNANKESESEYPSNKAITDYVDTNAIASFTFDSSTYQLKFYNADGTQIGSTIDLPIESVVVSGSYDSTTKTIILTLANGNTISISVGDLVSGLVKTSDIADNLTTNDSTKVLSAKQGKVLQDNKVEKTSSVYKVYATDSAGAQTTLDYSKNALNNTVAVRTANGAVKVSSCTDFDDAVPREFALLIFQTNSNKTTSLSSSSTDTQYPSAKCVYDKIEEIRALAQGKSTTYATSVDLTESDITGSISSGLVHYFDSQGVDKVFANATEFTTWKGTKTINQAFLSSTNFEINLHTELSTTHYFAVLKGGNALYVLDDDSYAFLFKENDDLNLFEEYPDRWYFDGALYSECRAPILTETTLVGATISQGLSSLASYMCTTALTSLTITTLSKATNDNNPTWQISFKTHASTPFSVTMPVGVRWANGTPTFYTDTEYTIFIKKSVTSGEYIAYLA